jgi:hypothetical protein
MTSSRRIQRRSLADEVRERGEGILADQQADEPQQ